MAETITGKRAQSTIQFPYNDLDDAVGVAKTIWDPYAGTCDLAQLAGAFGQPIQSGAFRTKVLAAKIFGFVQGTQTLTLTPLGRNVVSPEDEAGARTEAFLNVPLFDAVFDQVAPSGGLLPSSKTGLQQLIRSLGVVDKQVEKATQTFQRSARQAGYFEHGSDRLVRPAVTRRGAPKPLTEEAPAVDTPASPRERTEGVASHPLMVGLLQSLPAPGQKFSRAERDRWLNAVRVNFDFIYGPGDDETPPTPTWSSVIDTSEQRGHEDRT